MMRDKYDPARQNCRPQQSAEKSDRFCSSPNGIERPQGLHWETSSLPSFVPQERGMSILVGGLDAVAYFDVDECGFQPSSGSG